MRIFSQIVRHGVSCAVALLTGFAGLTGAHGQAAPGRLTVHVDKPGHAISPTLYGLMTEEISHSYDGGLYAELIQNRVFKDDPARPVHWALVQDGSGAGTMALDTARPVSEALGTSLRLDISTPGTRVGVANDGYWGIPVRPATAYRASFYARTPSAVGPLTVDIESADGATVYATATVPGVTSDWKKYAVTLTTAADAPTSEATRFVISAHQPGTVYFSLVSLFPPTFNDRPNGNRIDLMQKLAGLDPAFLRLPGGNYLEGNTIAERFEWKNTLGPLEQRTGHQGPWGYRSSDGMGMLEFLEWCEDLKMDTVLGVFAGYALGGEHVAPGPTLQPYVQDALDEIEYVTGSAKTTWGARRAADGHPKPFPLTYVEIGNEDGRFDYNGRFAQFYDAIRAKYPRLKIIATSPVTSRPADVLDDHYYRSAAAMEADATHYDKYDRKKGPKIFVGEWATVEGNPTATLNAALGDAAWLTGLERNSDEVLIASYAPLFVNVNPGGSQWPTNLIGFDALSSFGSPSYYVQALFSANRGDVVLPTEVTQPTEALPAPPAAHGQVGVGTWATQAEFRNVQVTHAGQTLYQKDFAQGDADWTLDNGTWQAADGVLRQTGGDTDCRAVVGDAGWTDYTYSLQARKTGGAEGFLILFHAQDPDNYIWWNVGGWGNSRTQLERARSGAKEGLGPALPITVQTGRWYDIKIEVAGSHIKCYLDGKLVEEADDTANRPMPIYAESSRDKATGDVILKVVNVAPTAMPLQIDLLGARSVSPTASCQVITGQPGDQNTLADPEKVAPQSQPITDAAKTFTHVFPEHSVSVIRIKTR